jgi:glycosyltransferase involved in cell wall biosynthesis
MSKRKIGIFTIASKNYLAYVRVLLKSVAAIHPEYALYLCLVDTVDGKFDPRAEVFTVIQSDSIGIPHFDDMAVRYDIMEFNTAVKPFMFQWLLDNTDLDSIIYLDPDTRAYSRFDRLEAVLASDVSVVLTPHITRPLEDGKSPNEYHMLQAGVFNLGFAAVNRCKEARGFLEWWGRRLETQASVDIARNLFTDQRWCDLAPCLLDRLHVFKHPGFNAAYWNLAERTVRQVRGQWRVNDEPLAFFHFSGISVGKESVVSKHQDRFTWKDLPNCKPLFDDYRHALLQEGWEQTQGWQYAYAKTKDGTPIPAVVRQLYRESHPTSQNSGASTAAKLQGLCNSVSSVVPFDSMSPITRLMEIIHRQRPDLQAAFNLGTHQGRAAFGAWYASAAFREFKLPAEFIRPVTPAEGKTPSYTATETIEEGLYAMAANRVSLSRRRAASPATASLVAERAPGLVDAWDRLPTAVKRLLAPVVGRMMVPVAADGEMQEPEAPDHPPEESNFKPLVTGRIDALRNRASLPQLLGEQRYISIFMHMIWSSRPDLQMAFDLDTSDGQSAFAQWFEASAQREYGVSARIPAGSEPSNSNAATTPGGSATPTRPGANLIGYAHAEIGMGEHVRMSAAALESTPVQFGVVNFNVGVVSRQEAMLDHGQIFGRNPFAANVFHVNADQMFVAYRHLGHDFFSKRYNIGYWAWELAKGPTDLLSASKMVDEIWAPSRFIQQAFAERADIPVEYMPLCVTLPEFNRLDRRHFGLPDRAFIFLYTFDFLSFLERKNPFAAIRAFKRAFPEGKSDVCLVLKVMNGKEESPLWMNMMQLIDGDPRIVIINRTLNRSEVLALLDTSDCFLSLHRSEGFGRGPAEAMYLGKPVIVTNYSGNTDFTLADNSCLVDFKLIPVEEGQYPCHQGQQWADADVEHAAWYMKKLHADSAYASDVGARGRAYIHENFNQRAIGAFYESRLKKLGLA